MRREPEALFRRSGQQTGVERMENWLKFIDGMVDQARRQRRLDKVLELLGQSHRVMILGCTGVGKTNFCQALRSIVVEAIDAANRTEFPVHERLRINEHLFSLIDVPGQDRHEALRKQAMLSAMRQPRLGVINVVCYGYHEFGEGREAAIDEQGRLRGGFLEMQRQHELESSYEWLQILGDRTTLSWYITVVAKADLWWQQRDEVMRYYNDGEYANSLIGLRDLGGAVVPFCSVFRRFYGNIPLAGTFDDADRLRLRENMFRVLVEAISRRSSHA